MKTTEKRKGDKMSLVNTPKDNPATLDKTLMGRLIAEIARFGGFDKKKASQLATILLPFIDQAIEAEIVKAREETINKVKSKLPEQAWYPKDKIRRTFNAGWNLYRERLLEVLDRINQLSGGKKK